MSQATVARGGVGMEGWSKSQGEAWVWGLGQDSESSAEVQVAWLPGDVAPCSSHLSPHMHTCLRYHLCPSTGSLTTPVGPLL